MTEKTLKWWREQFPNDRIVECDKAGPKCKHGHRINFSPCIECKNENLRDEIEQWQSFHNDVVSWSHKWRNEIPLEALDALINLLPSEPTKDPTLPEPVQLTGKEIYSGPDKDK